MTWLVIALFVVVVGGHELHPAGAASLMACPRWSPCERAGDFVIPRSPEHSYEALHPQGHRAATLWPRRSPPTSHSYSWPAYGSRKAYQDWTRRPPPASIEEH